MPLPDTSALAWLPSLARNVCLALLALSPLGAYNAADAAQRSGGRVGGSGFRSAPSQTRRYSAPPSRSYSPGPATRGYVERVPMAVPVLPYGGYGYGFSPFSPFGFGGGMVTYRTGISPIDVLVLGGLAYVAFNAIKNSIGGSQWDDVDDTPSSLGAGVTVLKIQVGLQMTLPATQT
ncbi:Protein of unknown function DUF1517 [Nannochloropsis gaditana]|uniref:Uncharacterized protein n=1 Tax=Nannochloropsis gaditana TaxID=72520 RepID=W7TQN6_9STRA|nr:Protein of unknown function DUF1517 [Nannochloropsis gaditana]